MVAQYLSKKKVLISAGGAMKVITILNSLKELDAENQMLLFI